MADIDPKERIIELNKEFEQEMDEWEKMGVDPSIVINFNPQKMEMWVKATTKHLVEKGIIDEDEWVICFKETYIEALKAARPEVAEQVKQARMEAMGINIPNMSVPRTRKLH